MSTTKTAKKIFTPIVALLLACALVLAFASVAWAAEKPDWEAIYRQEWRAMGLNAAPAILQAPGGNAYATTNTSSNKIALFNTSIYGGSGSGGSASNARLSWASIGATTQKIGRAAGSLSYEYLYSDILVTLDPVGGLVSPSAITVTTGQAYGTLPVPTYSGYTFTGWFTAAGGGDMVTAATTVTATEDHTLYAQWKSTSGGSGGGGNSNAYISPTSFDFDIKDGADIHITITRNGRTLMSITNGDYNLIDGTDYSISGDIINIKASYLAALGTGEHTIVFNMNGGVNPQLALAIKDTTQPEVTVTLDPAGGEVTPGVITVILGEAYGTLPTPLRADYDFKGWNTAEDGDGETVTAATIVALAEDHTLYAQWEKIDTGDILVEVTLAAAGGTVTPGAITVISGEIYGALPTPIYPGYDFIGWFSSDSGGVEITATTIVSATEDHTIYAQWKKILTGGGSSGGGNPNASIAPSNFEFDIKVSLDISVTLLGNGRSLIALTKGAYTLKEGTDYARSGNTVTITSGYLGTLGTGSHTIVFEMNGGVNPNLTLIIKDSSQPEEPEISITQPAYKPMAPLHSAGTKVDAVKTNNVLILDEEELDFPALKIGGYNWIKLRDFAILLNGGKKQFSIDYDEAANIIDIRTAGSYQPLGDELEDKLADAESAIASTQRLRVNGEFVDVAAYNIKGYNYFRLRDLAIILNFAIEYDETLANVTLDLDNPYWE